MKKIALYLLCLVLFSNIEFCWSQNFNDSLRVLTYNELDFGDNCQGTPTQLFPYLRKIVNFANADVFGMVKMRSIQTSPSDNVGNLPYGFADTIVSEGFNSMYPGRYAHAAYTALLGSSETTLLIYDQHKLGFLNVKTLVASTEDFNLYKLYVKDPYLATTHDTTFLYFVLNHTISGSEAGRDNQDTLVEDALKKMFYHLPNLVNMGDFNLTSSTELGYNNYVNNKDTNFRFLDGPFFPDKKLTYPINWDSDPNLCPYFLTTSTRASSTVPNSCGTSGGAKDWYDHILISPWIAENQNYIGYVSNSYHVIGQDGKRVGISINDSTTKGRNNAAPADVIDALWNFSNKYPVMETLGVTYNQTGTSLPDPTITAGIAPVNNAPDLIQISTIVNDYMQLQFADELLGKNLHLEWYDLTGRNIANETYTPNARLINKTVPVQMNGLYLLRISGNKYCQTFRIVKN